MSWNDASEVFMKILRYGDAWMRNAADLMDQKAISFLAVLVKCTIHLYFFNRRPDSSRLDPGDQCV